MVKQYPHIATITIASPATQHPDNGNWISNPATVIELGCRLEPNGAGRVIQLPDQRTIVFRFTVYMPLAEERVPDSAMVVVKDEEGNIIGTGSSLGFSKGQFNRRVWL